MIRLREIFVTLVATILAGCGGSQEKSSEFIPDLPVECTSGQAADCAGNQLKLFAGIIDSIAGARCDDFLTGMTELQRRNTFLASGYATSTRSGKILTATVKEWISAAGGSIDVLNPGVYIVCAFIDTNGDGRIDTNEPVAEGKITSGKTGFVMTDWAPAYN